MLVSGNMVENEKCVRIPCSAGSEVSIVPHFIMVKRDAAFDEARVMEPENNNASISSTLIASPEGIRLKWHYVFRNYLYNLKWSEKMSKFEGGFHK